MTRQDWIRIGTAFHQALSLEAHHREPFVARFAEREPDLVPLLCALLAADAEGEQRLLEDVATLARSVLRSSRRRR